MASAPRKTRKLDRRTLGKLLLAMPAAFPAALGAGAASRGARVQATSSSDLTRCLASIQGDFSADERKRLEKSITELQKSLDAIRQFELPPDTEPSLFFQPLKSKR